MTIVVDPVFKPTTTDSGMDTDTSEKKTDSPEKQDSAPSRRERLERVLRRITQGLLALLLIYASIVLIGLIPVNNDFIPPEDGIEIRIISTAVHADIIVPLVTDDFDWTELFPHELFPEDTQQATHLAIGWGDRGFFLETPTWNDLTLRTAAAALLWPTDSCIHATMMSEGDWRGEGRAVRISRQQYRMIVQFIQRYLKRDETGGVIVIPEITYGDDDVFVESRGRYHAVNTCNTWVGRGMKQAGIRTAWLTPMPRTMFIWLPEDDDRVEAAKTRY
jgi:uncharacterized protein (TIGR02117 family)